MLIKTIKNNVESEWFELTKAHHRALLEDQPEAAIVRIEELYPGSPDEGCLVRLDFELFTVLARDFVLEESRQAKRTERYHDQRPIEEISFSEYQSSIVTMEDANLHKEQLCQLEAAKQRLTPTQKRRLTYYIDNGLSLRQIAVLEGVDNTAVDDSIHSAYKKIKKFLK